MLVQENLLDDSMNLRIVEIKASEDDSKVKVKDVDR